MTDNADKKKSLKDFRRIPGVGPSIAEDLYGLGYRSVSDLTGEIPEDMYEKLCMMQGQTVDRCMLYVFRCAVYFARTPESDYDPELLKWWSWKD
ncbi:helix-hairpin-helix domain-containing protein [Methanoplanus endosymbiosus]|uniref:Helix-hairpin-helix domain-containing protein n=1 Tax=Methanoplanus endosymbiosus TaxID=33865 RepID=A0A9E7TGN9_9EURY|nr:helix-hairpin-helix domain-containing protein [Methanoplanus endosymbiosus]UUX91497.1 helix-hairpin-helix domain-containing protein [Methanoplanus endosymbiosus]